MPRRPILASRLFVATATATAIAGDRATAMIAYRAAAAENAPADLLELMRWQIPIYSAKDSQVAQQTELDAWRSVLKINSQMPEDPARAIRYPDGFTPQATPTGRRGPANPPARRGPANPTPLATRRGRGSVAPPIPNDLP